MYLQIDESNATLLRKKNGSTHVPHTLFMNPDYLHMDEIALILSLSLPA